MWRKHKLDAMLLILLLVTPSSITAFSPSSPPRQWNFETTPLISTMLETTKDSSSDELLLPPSAHLIFPGGGIFFYWQAGVISYLREQGYDLSDVTMTGASAGALTATLTATNVDFYKATDLALELAQDAGVWDRSGGLQGVWGPMIETWLDELLPPDPVELVDERLSLLVTPVPSFGKNRVSIFADKSDLIRCNMASVHLPFFLDSKLTSNFRDKPHIDGSFLAGKHHYLPNDDDRPILCLDWKNDPAMEGKALEFVKTVSKDTIWNFLEQGKAYARTMEKRGDFETLQRL